MLCLKKVNLLILLAFCMAFSACSKSKKNKQICFLSEYYSHFPYTINQPAYTYVLDNALREISGLTYAKENKLLCVNDEQGYIFEYDTQQKKISRRIKFAKKGDFEGVELIGNECIVLRSDGKLYFVGDIDNMVIESDKVKTGLGPKNNTEGLAYDPSTHSLLIACKGMAYANSAYSDKRAIYRYSITDSLLIQEPNILIDQGDLETILNLDAYIKFSNKLLKGLSPSKGNLTFQPSGLAIHPISKNIYVIGSVGKLLLVLSPQGELLAVNRLKRKIFPQPEGICFAPDGTLYISTEGKVKQGRIYQFEYKPILND
ncbi:SdiA-regulated domain-containing protein [Ancylomarina sp. YFZ004]